MLVTGDHDLLNLNLDDLEISRRDRAHDPPRPRLPLQAHVSLDRRQAGSPADKPWCQDVRIYRSEGTHDQVRTRRRSSPSPCERRH
jgi:hypothetical protein